MWGRNDMAAYRVTYLMVPDNIYVILIAICYDTDTAVVEERENRGSYVSQQTVLYHSVQYSLFLIA